MVNPLQGKHIPISPSRALGVFDDLADLIKGLYPGEELLLVSFAETATAIGAEAAVRLGASFMQTTRETVPDVEYFYFSEEHSHATEQKLVKNDLDYAAGMVHRIVFVEDEVTTGKTILNIITLLQKCYPRVFRYSVLSLLNGMDQEALDCYHNRGIALHYLVKSNHSAYAGFTDLADLEKKGGVYYPPQQENRHDFELLEIHQAVNPRRLVEAGVYQMACERLWNEVWKRISESLSGAQKERILVAGTEECMYPALYIGAKLEALGYEVRSHSTTRSPILVSREKDYPLHERYELRSMYDSRRTIFLYDIDAYDRVIVLTDAPEKTQCGQIGLNTLINALWEKNKKITVIRWC